MEGKEFKKELIRRYRDNKATEEELEVFFHAMSEDELDMAMEEVMNEEAEKDTGKNHVIPFYKRSWIRAAAVLVILTSAAYFLLNKNNTGDQQIASQQNFTNDIAPGGNRAVLTLSDGSAIILDSAGNGEISQQGNTIILKNDGQLAYNINNEKPTEVIYNTISTPRGGQYQIVLSDGTKVWLNAASSLHFPANFIGKERKVELTGEAYFEVAKNTAMPFKVIVAGKTEVEVVGTHFNINSYTDESSINTTLLEGKVKVSAIAAQNTLFILPGQQARQNINGQISINANADTEEVMAWKNGKFQFGEKADIPSIMRQLARWYDVDIEYKGTVAGHIGGSMSRNVNVSQVLKMLEKTGVVKFSIEGKKLIVMP